MDDAFFFFLFPLSDSSVKLIFLTQHLEEDRDSLKNLNHLGMERKTLLMNSTTELQLQILLGITDPFQDEASENESLCCLLKPLLST